MQWFIENGETIIAIGTGIVTVAGLITSLTATPKDDGLALKLRKLLDILALNIRHAKNAGGKRNA